MTGCSQLQLPGETSGNRSTLREERFQCLDPEQRQEQSGLLLMVIRRAVGPCKLPVEFLRRRIFTAHHSFVVRRLSPTCHIVPTTRSRIPLATSTQSLHSLHRDPYLALLMVRCCKDVLT